MKFLFAIYAETGRDWIRLVDDAGNVSTLAGTEADAVVQLDYQRIPLDARFSNVVHMTPGPDGSLYLADND